MLAKQPRTYTGESLREIAFPLGGIGTGMVSLGGRGQLRDWEIFNRPGKGKDLPYTFFAIYAQAEGAEGVARVLERRFQPPFSAGFGLPTSKVAGLPRLKEATFSGDYPFAWLDFEEPTLPVSVHLEAYNPFIPMNEADSGLPIACFRWTLINQTDVPVEATIAFNLLNAVGYDGKANLSGRHHEAFGKNLNTWREEESLRGIFMTSDKYASDASQFGSMAVVTDWADATYKIRWERAGWWDDVQNFWDEFHAGRGTLSSQPETTPSPDGQTDVGVLGLRAWLAPHETVTLPFVVAWHFPNLTTSEFPSLTHAWSADKAVQKPIGNWYGTQFADAWEAARYAVQNAERLRNESLEYHEALYSSTLPTAVLDAAGANASIVKTPTVLRTSDGRMNAFEGCGDNEGCCPMNCTHVWNYVQTVAYLFPALERSVRKTDFQHNTRLDGDMAFRTILPLVQDHLWLFDPAADGQMGTVMKAYREWLQCGDRAFLESIWEGVGRALEAAWRHWDADKDGVMEGKQHNTYDIEFYGPNTMMGTFYLGALRAGEEMARALGHEAKAQEYRAVFESGSKKYAEMLWNGEYYKQIVNLEHWEKTKEPFDPEKHPDSMQHDTEPRYQYGAGCLADQVLGQWFARVVGLGDLLPQEQMKSALQSIFRYNWKSDLTDHETVQRVYALNEEAGLLLCTWPFGGRPQYPFPYADEVWTGIEYQVAAHCLYEGLIEEGLAIVEGARERHDGVKRNPWDEFECGHHYARAMASWSLILALSGYQYHAAEGCLTLKPQISQEKFRCFVSAGAGWGWFQSEDTEEGYTLQLHASWGAFHLQSLVLPLGARRNITAHIAGVALDATVEEPGTLRFADPLELRAGETLEVSA